MLRALSVAILAFWSCFAFAASESAMSLLDNRFRVDPTIEQITFWFIVNRALSLSSLSALMVKVLRLGHLRQRSLVSRIFPRYHFDR